MRIRAWCESRGLTCRVYGEGKLWRFNGAGLQAEWDLTAGILHLQPTGNKTKSDATMKCSLSGLRKALAWFWKLEERNG